MWYRNTVIIVIAVLSLLFIGLGVRYVQAGSFHKTPPRNKSTIVNYQSYVKQYNKQAENNLRINKQKRKWALANKAYRRNPEPSNPIYPPYKQQGQSKVSE